MRSASPAATLRADRTAKLVQLAVFGVTFGLAMGLVNGLVAGPVIGLVDGIGAGLVGVVVGLARSPHVWTAFVLTRSVLAARGKLAWRLMSFLDDAHHAGVLRASGGAYQFRRALLQDHLAGGAPTGSTLRSVAHRPVRRPRMRRLAALAATTLVVGTGFGVGLPIAGGLQTRCGLTPFDPDVRYLRAGLDSDCVGVSDGRYVFTGEATKSRRGSPRRTPTCGTAASRTCGWRSSGR